MTQKTSGPARERQRRRRERREMARISGGARRQQTQTPSSIRLPKISLPNNPIVYVIPVGMILMVGVIVALGLLKNDEPQPLSNAIWLDTQWTYANPSDEDLTELVNTLRENRVGTVYAYVSSLNSEGYWVGGDDGTGQFTQSANSVRDFAQRFKEAYPDSQLFGWVEVWGNLDSEDGYRLDDEALQETVADFGRRVVNDLSFDGVFLDVKPVANDNEDYLTLLTRVRSRIGLSTPFAIAIPPDLTPANTDLNQPPRIAPNTMWDNEYKQRVLLKANQIVITAYQSYRDNPVDYIEWVSYHVETYTRLLVELELEATTEILISIPHYQASSDAHNPNIETIPAALDGVNVGIEASEENGFLIAGVAIYTDAPLTESDWGVFRSKWLGG